MPASVAYETYKSEGFLPFHLVPIMVICVRCTQDFPQLDKDFCGICTKLRAMPPPVMPDVRKSITVIIILLL